MHFENNPASGRVLEKLGFQHEGILVEHAKKDGRFRNRVCWGLLNRS
jgi:RimJ/RimL family protein N-acetyltransferase